MHVLVVDDESAIRYVIGRVLNALECTMVEACNGVEALKVLSNTHVDLVILDLSMPMLSGLDVLRALRASGEHAQLPVVLISGAVNNATAVEAMQFDPVDFLAKPLAFDEMRERLRFALQSVGKAVPPRGVAAGLPGTARPILIVDGNAEFRYFVSSVLASRYTTIQAGSGLDALTAFASNPPAAVLVGADLGLFGTQLLVQKLRSLRECSDTKILLVVADDAAPGIDPMMVDGVLRRSFVPEEFLAQFHEHYERTLGGFALIRGTLVSATQQALGMMAHLDVVSVPETDSTVVAGDVVGKITVRVLEGHTVAQIVLWCSPECATRIAARAMEVDEATLTAEDGLSMMGETLNVMAGRVQAAIVAQKGTASFTLPEFAVAEASEVLAATDGLLRFESAQWGISFRLALVDPEQRVTRAA